MTEPLRLDLGSGPNPPDGWQGLDARIQSDRVHQFDLCSGDRWPFDDEGVDALRASHFIEHIPAKDVTLFEVDEDSEELLYCKPVRTQDALLFVFEEAWRIAKPGATFELRWPALQSPAAFQDPTHRRFLPLHFLDYLSEGGRSMLGVGHYDVRCNWVVENQKQLMVVLVSGEQAPADWMRYWGEAVEYRAVLTKYQFSVHGHPNP